ncbi:hypothetical protein F5Y00DRAFT_264427 [Daldinia vernicosa]|uniref:uncharacterized protein n=1 Tax=Daldinia vernicosa TaxID=114800 RepID=UPI002008DFE6|nr:uncharacterized protein F5Y00DRAFT_264427 [Daldinia vernicosa]KAI0846614.1 hypothetical protein F5Y00DRAFT_264427 [Daldinia vernicosa]
MPVSSQPSQPSSSPTGMHDPLDLFDFSQFEGAPSYGSTSALASSPLNTKEFTLSRGGTVTTPSILPTTQALSGPSHQYDRYKQQTPFVPGALTNTMALNNSSQVSGYAIDFIPEIGSNEDTFDFNTVPSRNMCGGDMDLDFDPASDPSYFFPETTIDPNTIGGESQAITSPTVPSQTSNVGRMYPGMHQQAALAKAQAQQRQQQHIIQQRQNQQAHQQAQQTQQQRSKAPLPSDPIVEQKITQLLNSMRSKAGASPGDSGDNSTLLQLPRSKKDEDDMDEDERLLASEEGKKLSSKERRQLRNKVSARAFRSRRKEYITQLETEIANKVTENGDLRAQNRALIEENKRLTDFSQMLLRTPAFSNFLDNLTANNPCSQESQQQQQQQQQQPQHEQQQHEAQVSKDVNPFVACQQNQHQQIGMVMMPEQTMDVSMLNIHSDFKRQPRWIAQ